MSYQQRPGTQRDFDRPKKTKSKKIKISHSTGIYYEEKRSQAQDEIVAKTLTALETLGSQTFAITPFRQHFETWVKSLQTVVDDFALNHVIEPDDKFREECKIRIIAVEEAFKEEQTKEISRETKIFSLQGSKDLLINMEQEYNKKVREQASRRDIKLKALNSSVKTLKTELEDVQKLKAGFLEAITKSKMKKEQDASSRLIAAEKELNAAKASFEEELTLIQSEYDHEKRVILEKITAERVEVDRLIAEAKIDSSIEIRLQVCEELAKAVKNLLKRVEVSTTEQTTK
jgi:hypothetical protein